MRPIQRLLPFVAAMVAAGSPGFAAEVSAEQAQQLERGIRAWLAETVGPTVPLPARPVQLEPTGDRYRMVAPTGDEGMAVTGTVRPVEGGTWAIEGVRIPLPARFGYELPDPANLPGGKVRTDYFLRLGEHDVSALYDPSFQTASILTSSYRDADLLTTTDGEEQRTRVARYTGQSALRPADAGRVDVVSDDTAEGYVVDGPTPDGRALKVEIARLRSQGELRGVSRERAPQVLQAMLGMVGEMTAAAAAAANGTPMPALRTPRVLAEAVQELASSLRTEQVAEGVHVRVGEAGGSAERARVEFGLTTPEGILALRMDLEAEGIQFADLPLTPAQQGLLPRRFALRPTVTGIASADVMRLALDATDPAKEREEFDLARLFSHGGLKMGLESFALELGGATFTGNARVAMPTPGAVGGDGQVTAAGFETLMGRVKAVPEFGGAVPALAFAKGIARTNADRLVWDISYRDGRMLVNDVDMSAMAGTGRK